MGFSIMALIFIGLATFGTLLIPGMFWMIATASRLRRERDYYHTMLEESRAERAEMRQEAIAIEKRGDDLYDRLRLSKIDNTRKTALIRRFIRQGYHSQPANIMLDESADIIGNVMCESCGAFFFAGMEDVQHCPTCQKSRERFIGEHGDRIGILKEECGGGLENVGIVADDVLRGGKLPEDDAKISKMDFLNFIVKSATGKEPPPYMMKIIDEVSAAPGDMRPCLICGELMPVSFDTVIQICQDCLIKKTLIEQPEYPCKVCGFPVLTPKYYKGEPLYCGAHREGSEKRAGRHDAGEVVDAELPKSVHCDACAKDIPFDEIYVAGEETDPAHYCPHCYKRFIL